MLALIKKQCRQEMRGIDFRNHSKVICRNKLNGLFGERGPSCSFFCLYDHSCSAPLRFMGRVSLHSF